MSDLKFSSFSDKFQVHFPSAGFSGGYKKWLIKNGHSVSVSTESAVWGSINGKIIIESIEAEIIWYYLQRLYLDECDKK